MLAIRIWCGSVVIKDVNRKCRRKGKRKRKREGEEKQRERRRIKDEKTKITKSLLYLIKGSGELLSFLHSLVSGPDTDLAPKISLISCMC